MLDNQKKTTMSCRDDSSLLRSVVRGFTLIELLVVVLIIGILASVALPQYQIAVAKARYVQLMVAGDGLIKSYQLYVMENGTEPASLEDLALLPAGSTASTSSHIDLSGGGWCRWSLSYGELFCRVSDSAPHWMYFTPSYVTVSLKGKRVCRAYDEFQQKICRSLGGQLHAASSSGSYTNYVLP